MAKARQKLKLGANRLKRHFRDTARMADREGKKSAARAGAQVVLDQAKQNVRDTFENRTGHLEGSGHLENVRAGRVDVVFDAVHSAAHEYGLPEFQITKKQRRFFWAMWFATKDEMWLALALSTTYTIPARPYLGPATRSTRRAVGRAMAREYNRIFRQSSGAFVSVGGRLQRG